MHDALVNGFEIAPSASTVYGNVHTVNTQTQYLIPAK